VTVVFSWQWLIMGNSDDIRWQRLTGQLGNIAYELSRVQFTQINTTQLWRPAINAYRCGDEILVCVDLAGVDRSQIELQIEARRLIVRGRRVPPEPDRAQHNAFQVLAMEIDFGPFERELRLPANVDSPRATAEHRDGLLWIRLPFQPQD
jgi:HSP20 family protein